jgi:L-fucose mutarotase
VLRYRLTHPQILAALAAAGHGSEVLITDGHYPVSTAAGHHAIRVFLNLESGRPTVPEVLAVLIDAIPLEAATTMQPPASEGPQEILSELDQLLPPDVKVTCLERFAFYEAARSPNLALIIATGERRRFGNILLRLGVLR